MGEAARPVCEFCRRPGELRQRRVRGVLVFLHLGCDFAYEQHVAPKPTAQVGAIPVTEDQLAAIERSAAALAEPDRPAFLGKVAEQLRGCEVGDGAVGRAIRAAQSKFAHRQPARNEDARGPHVRSEYR